MYKLIIAIVIIPVFLHYKTKLFTKCCQSRLPKQEGAKNFHIASRNNVPKMKKVEEEVFKFSFQNPNSNLKINYLLITYTTFYFHWLICFLNITTLYFGFHPWNPCYVQHDLMLRSTRSTILPWLLVEILLLPLVLAMITLHILVVLNGLLNPLLLFFLHHMLLC